MPQAIPRTSKHRLALTFTGKHRMFRVPLPPMPMCRTPCRYAHNAPQGLHRAGMRGAGAQRSMRTARGQGQRQAAARPSAAEVLLERQVATTVARGADGGADVQGVPRRTQRERGPHQRRLARQPTGQPAGALYDLPQPEIRQGPPQGGRWAVACRPTHAPQRWRGCGADPKGVDRPGRTAARQPLPTQPGNACRGGGVGTKHGDNCDRSASQL